MNVCLKAAIAASLLLAVPSAAGAQAWLEDRARTEGPGFRVGDFELHPGLGVELGYDSNIYYTQDGGPIRDSGILRATAHLLFATRGPARRAEGEAGGEGDAAALPPLIFRGGVAGSFYHYFNDIDRTNMEANANLALGILPGRPVSIAISDVFARSIRPFTENFLAVGGRVRSHARDQNDAAVVFHFATDGDVLHISTGYQLGLDFFEDADFQYATNLKHTISLNETFRFLPQTGIVHDTQIMIVDYLNELAPAPTLLNDGVLLRTRIGINGAFTNEFSVLVAAGYGAGFFASRAASVYDMEYESVVAQAEARWQIMPTMRLAFGYDRDFQPSFLGNSYRRDRGYVNYQALIDRVFLLGLEVSLGYYEFAGIVQPDGVTPVGSSLNRGDIRFIAGLFAEYRFTDWLGVNGTLRYTGNFTDYQYNVVGVPVPDPAGFNKFEAWLGVRAFY